MKAILIRSEFIATHVKRFLIKTEFPMVAEAGQFVTISFPQLLDDSGRCVERSYSLLNWFSEENGHHFVELCISLNPDGVVTPWLWRDGIGSEFQISSPLGSFTLKDYQSEGYQNIDALIFVCTGTGIAPFIPMIRLALERYADKQVFLFSGNRKYADELFADEIQSLLIENPQFRYFPVFSREPDAKNYGYVHAFYKNVVSAESHVYVCGWSGMCQESRKHLKELGLTRKQYFFEQYD